MIHYDGGKSFIEENFLYKFFIRKRFSEKMERTNIMVNYL